MMTSRHLSRICLMLVAACLTMLTAGAVEPAIIAKARTYLGSETALNQVTSLHYVGTMMLSSSGDAKQAPVGVDIIFQHPSRQRSQLTADNRIEITVLDGYDGWQRVQDPVDASRWTLSLMKPDQIRNLRANVSENLSFFRSVPGRGGSVEDLGAATIDGVSCRKIAFVYSPNIIFYRYFDTDTGRLVLTETKQGESIREQGEIVAGGLKFPKTLVTTLTQADGSVHRVTIDFEKVIVNEIFPDSLFVMPLLGTR